MSVKYNQPLSGFVVPRYGGIPTFMRLPHCEDPVGVDIGLIGVPWDGGTTNRAGAPARAPGNPQPVVLHAPGPQRDARVSL